MTNGLGTMRRGYLVAWRLLHRGRGRKCPACGTTVSRFAPYGTAHRPDAQCPGCGSLERHRALWLYLRERTDKLMVPIRVLAVAPDPYLEQQAVNLPWDYLSIDIRSGKAMRAMDLTSLALPGADRDLVIAYHVLEHIVDDHAAMLEIRRVLKPTGLALLEVPLEGNETDERYMRASPRERAERYGQADHVRLYGAADFRRRLSTAGLDAEEVCVGDLFADLLEVHGLISEERFFVATPAAAPDIEEQVSLGRP
jgi:SAM-dependent methyltransferase